MVMSPVGLGSFCRTTSSTPFCSNVTVGPLGQSASAFLGFLALASALGSAAAVGAGAALAVGAAAAVAAGFASGFAGSSHAATTRHDNPNKAQTRWLMGPDPI